MSDVIRMRVKGMTCGHCETSVASALKEAGADDVKVAYRIAQAVFTAPAAADLVPYQEALSRAGYRAGSAEVLEGESSPHQVETPPLTTGRGGWLAATARIGPDTLRLHRGMRSAGRGTFGRGAQ